MGKRYIKVEVKRDPFFEAGVIAEGICDKLKGKPKPEQYYVDKIINATKYKVDDENGNGS